jgi:hypothetical protein
MGNITLSYRGNQLLIGNGMSDYLLNQIVISDKENGRECLISCNTNNDAIKLNSQLCVARKEKVDMTICIDEFVSGIKFTEAHDSEISVATFVIVNTKSILVKQGDKILVCDEYISIERDDEVDCSVICFDRRSALDALDKIKNSIDLGLDTCDISKYAETIIEL